MKILLEALVLDEVLTGIAKVTLGLYQACLSLRPDLQVTALRRRRGMVPMPAGIGTRQLANWLPGRVWRRTVPPLVASLSRPDCAHFPWNGRVPWLPRRVRVVTTLHDVLPLVIPGFFRNAGEEKAYRLGVQRDLDRTDLLVTDSEYSRREISAHFAVRSAPLVVYPGPTLEADGAAPPTGLEPGGYFVYVGGYHARKGLGELVGLVTELRREGKLATRLVLTGARAYYSAAFRALVEKACAAGAVEERGYVSDAELTALLQHAKALVYPSRYEGFGLPPLEAMALGCPVLTSPHTAIPEVCGDAVLYAEPGDRDGFAEALLGLDADADLRVALSARGRQRAARFDWGASARVYLAALDQVLAESEHR